MPVMTLERWKERTYISPFHPRSTKMVGIDNALKSYHKSKSLGALAELKRAIEDFMSSREDWADSKRNRGGAIQDLYAQVKSPDSVVMTPEEREAYLYMQQGHKDIARRLFEGSQLNSKKLAILSALNTIRSDLSTAKKSAETAGLIKHAGSNVHQATPSAHHVSALHNVGSQLAPIGHHLGQGLQHVAQPALHGARALASSLDFQHVVNVVHELVHLLVDATVVAEILHDLIQPIIHEIVATMTPYIGMAKSGATAIVNWGKAARDIYRMHWTANKEKILLGGAPREALDAMGRLIERELSGHVASALIATTDAVVRGALIAADYGAGSQAIVGGVTALANLTQTLFVAGVDYYEKFQANRVLKTPDQINLRIFETHPILGCYLLTSADTSALLDVVRQEFGQIGWMGNVETDVRNHLLPLQELATGYIDSCRFELIKDGKPYAGAFYRTGLIGTKKQALTRKVVRTAQGAVNSAKGQLGLNHTTPIDPSRLKGISSRG